MIESLQVRNFTVFSEADFNFVSGLNVLVGENGTGKTHLLKLAYCVAYTANFEHQNGKPDSSGLNRWLMLGLKLNSVFKSEEFVSLIRRSQGHPASQADVSCVLSSPKATLRFAIEPDGVARPSSTGSFRLSKPPVYLPSRELLSIYPGFVSLYEAYHLEVDATWRDACVLLGGPLLKKLDADVVEKLVQPLEAAMGGKIELDASGRFYLRTGENRVEMHLVAEGARKLAMLARLVANGALSKGKCLFWDEPEANLNPKMIRAIAQTILHLCRYGVQVFIATHSLFLLREIDILASEPRFSQVPIRFFGLRQTDAGVKFESGDSITDVGDVTALEEALSQADRYLAKEGSQ